MVIIGKNIKQLLRKYETKQPGEIWENKTSNEKRDEWRYTQKFFILQTIVTEYKTVSNGHFIWTKEHEKRAMHIIQNVPAPTNVKIEEFLACVIIYVKLEFDRFQRFSFHKNMLKNYNVNEDKFIRLMIRINKNI